MAVTPLAEPLGLFRSERALVTGSASSIGRAIAIRLALEGCEVSLADIDPKRKADTLAAIIAAGGKAHALTCDLSKPGGYRDVLAALGAATPHMMVHAASPPRHETDDVSRVDEATWDAMTTTNVRSGFFLGRDLALAMRRDGIAGRMLFITSVHAQTPRNLPHYSVSKAGMKMVVEELARAFAPDGIRVNALAPGAVPGGGSKNTTADAFRAKIPMRRVGTPDDMASTAMALLSDRFTPYVTGTTTHVDGGLALYNWIPFSE
jgi:NAD(P)-dependent dehydrogenase (short-subunit alcohol dehydrogenase family)